MATPPGFSWVEKPLLAALARPNDAEDLLWLRRQGIDLLISLTEDRPRRDWIDNAGLFSLHVPVVDMEAPTEEQIDQCLSFIQRAQERHLGVAIHCRAGLGRTGTILACFFVSQGLTANDAISKVRGLRPGSIETIEQEEAIQRYARGLKHKE
jgi:atypical dual specificity phosphatase